MKPDTSYIQIAIIVSVLFSGWAQNAVADTTEDWDAGQRAFSQGDFRAALHSFQSAVRSGLDGPAIHYNIAVCYFKLQEFERSEQAFHTIGARYPAMRGLAEYNLGLIAHRLDNPGSARRHFLRAYELSPQDRKLRILSSSQLRKLEPEDSSSLWTGSIGIRGGIDDHIALRDELGLPPGVANESPMVDVFGSVRGPWLGRNGIRLDASAYLIRYFDAAEFDQTDIRGRVFYAWNPSDWHFEVGAHIGSSSLGDDAFDRKAGADARAIWKFNQSNSLDLRFYYDDISHADPVYVGISGSRQLFDARYRWVSDGHRLALRYSSENNDRLDPGVSPSRNRIGVGYRFQPDKGWGYEVGVNIRSSEYEDLAVPRSEDLSNVRLGLTHMLSERWLIMFDFQYSENDSSDVTYSYDGNQITFGVMKIF